MDKISLHFDKRIAIFLRAIFFTSYLSLENRKNNNHDEMLYLYKTDKRGSVFLNTIYIFNKNNHIFRE